MFGKLREKLGGWFKKKPEEEKVVEGKSKKKKIEKKNGKNVKKKEVKIGKKFEGGKTAEKNGKKKDNVWKEVRGKKEGKVEKKIEEKKEKVSEIKVPASQPEDKREAEVIDEDVGEKLKAKADEIKEEGVVGEKKGFFGKLFGKKEEDEVKEEEGRKLEEEVVEEKGELVEESEVTEEKEEKIGFFGRLKKRLSTSVLTQEQFDDAFEDLQMTLLENNVALEVVDKIHDSLSKDLVDISIKKGEIERAILQSLKDSILEVLVEGEDLFKKIEKNLEDPYVILFFGINGSGKTTSIAKLAHALKSRGISCVMGAGDTFRSAAIEQLETHAQRIGVPIVKSDYGKDSASVGFDTIAYARKNKIRVVLLDSAGRMYTSGNLMKEMEKIVKVTKPNMKIFVGESITGNDATSQAKSFNDKFGIDGIILSKADVDEKAGTILSVGSVTGKPILFLGVGQEYGDLEVFRKGKVLEGLGLE